MAVSLVASFNLPVENLWIIRGTRVESNRRSQKSQTRLAISAMIPTEHDPSYA